MPTSGSSSGQSISGNDSFSHNHAGGTNPAIMVCIQGYDMAAGVSSVTYDGTGMETESFEAPNGNDGLYIGGLASPSTGSNTLSVTFGSQNDIDSTGVVIFDLTDCDQTDVFDTATFSAAGDDSTDPASISISSTSDGLVVGSLQNDEASMSPNGTQIHELDDVFGSEFMNVQEYAGTGSNVTVSWDNPDNGNNWSYGGVNVLHAAGGTTFDEEISLNYALSLAESNTISYAETLAISYGLSIAETNIATMNETLAMNYGLSIAETNIATMNETLAVNYAMRLDPTAPLTIADTVAISYALGLDVSEILNAVETVQINYGLSFTESNTLTVAETLAISYALRTEVSETMTIEESLALTYAVGLGVSGGLSFDETVELAYKLGLDVSETVTATAVGYAFEVLRRRRRN